MASIENAGFGVEPEARKSRARVCSFFVCVLILVYWHKNSRHGGKYIKMFKACFGGIQWGAVFMFSYRSVISRRTFYTLWSNSNHNFVGFECWATYPPSFKSGHAIRSTNLHCD